jgi:hypothetical protein
MSRNVIIAAGAIVLSAGLAAAPATAADCTSEVHTAVQKQTKQIAYRMKANVISSEGPLEIVTSYVLPGRMHQVATLAADNKPVETLLVDGKAWIKENDGWVPLTFQHTEQLLDVVRRSTAFDADAVGKFDCMGTEKVDGRDQRIYRSHPMVPGGVKGPDGKEIETTAKNEAVRVIYVDSETGLPSQSVLAREGTLDKAINKEVYSYPADLKIEPPPADKLVPR